MTLAAYARCGRLSARSAAVVLASSIAAAAMAEELGHDRFHDGHYRHWKQPGTDVSCCSDHDCAPVTAEFRRGQWFALRAGQWLDWLQRGQSPWIAVPEERILYVPNPTVEGAHLCYSKGTVICFVPPNTGG